MEDHAPFHAALVQEMDHCLDLFGRGPRRFRKPLDGVRVAVEGARVVGDVAYDHVFARHAKVPPAPESLQTLFGRQEVVHREVLASLARSRGTDCAILWESACKEVSRGFAVAHIGRPAPAEVPDVLQILNILWLDEGMSVESIQKAVCRISSIQAQVRL